MQSPPPDPPAQLTPAFRFLVGFWKIGQGLGDYLNPLLEDRYDLSLRDYLVLNTIHWGVHYPTELAKRLKMSKDMTSRIIHKLLEAGLLERSIDEEDSRRTRLVASGDGQRRREEIEQTIETTIGSLLEELGPDESDILIGSLEIFGNLIGTTLGGNRANDL